jgi:hypothetical protein
MKINLIFIDFLYKFKSDNLFHLKQKVITKIPETCRGASMTLRRVTILKLIQY